MAVGVGLAVNVSIGIGDAVGVRVGVSPNSASVLAGFKDQQVFDIIDSVF